MKRLVLVAAALVMMACDDGRPAKVAGNGCVIKAYGNGVFYFSCAFDFGSALAEFRKDHQIITITSYSGGDGGTYGYWVVTQ